MFTIRTFFKLVLEYCWKFRHKKFDCYLKVKLFRDHILFILWPTKCIRYHLKNARTLIFPTCAKNKTVFKYNLSFQTVEKKINKIYNQPLYTYSKNDTVRNVLRNSAFKKCIRIFTMSNAPWGDFVMKKKICTPLVAYRCVCPRDFSRSREKSTDIHCSSQEHLCLIRANKLNGKLTLTQSDEFPRDSASRISAGGETGSVCRLFRCDPLVRNQNCLTETNTSWTPRFTRKKTNFSSSTTSDPIIARFFYFPFLLRFIVQ